MALDDKERKNQYSPFQVRVAIENTGQSAPIDQHRYRELSGIGSHVNKNTVPQAYNVLGIPSAASSFQEVGLLLALNELALAVALAGCFSALLVKELNKDIRLRITVESRNLAASIGGVDVLHLSDMWRDMRNIPSFEDITRFMKVTQKRPLTEEEVN